MYSFSSNKVSLQPFSSKEVYVSDGKRLNSSTVENAQEMNDKRYIYCELNNCFFFIVVFFIFNIYVYSFSISLNNSSKSINNIFKKSLANIDLNSIKFTTESLPMLKRLLCNGRNEVIALRRKMKSKRMSIYRYKKRVTDVKSLTSNMKNRKYLSDNVSKILEVSTNSYLHK